MTRTAPPPAPRLARGDFVRAPLLANARPDGYKEWYHFLVHQAGWRLLVNLSLTAGGDGRLVPRVIVLADDGRWDGVLRRFDPAELDVSPDLGALVIGRNRMTVGTDGYHLVVDLPDRDIHGELWLAPKDPRYVQITNQPAGSGRMNWLFVPRLSATGRFRIGGREHRLDGAAAYHDHNWGRFRWGDDFGWEWGSVLCGEPDRPCSLVFMRMTDRSRLRTLSQALYVCRPDAPALLFRDGELRVRGSGLLVGEPDCTLPPPMRLLLGGGAADVPASLEVTAKRRGDSVTVVVQPGSFARVAYPSEVHLDRAAVLCESAGPAAVHAVLAGERIDGDGDGVFEMCHG